MGITSINDSKISPLFKKTLKETSWLGFFKFFSQSLSWIATIVIARLLSPDDYGIMAMATIITGYVEVFSELGIGAAIIQKEKITDNELCSLFWFSFAISFVLSLTCYPLSYITAWVMNDERTISLTQAVSVLFILSALQTIPNNLLKKNLDFKAVGIIEMAVTVMSITAMIPLAYAGFGAWALLGGRILRGLFKTIILNVWVKWIPRLHFRYSEVKGYLRFGLIIASNVTVFYMWDRSDKLFAGRVWSTADLGIYSFALQLAQIPTDRIVTLVNQVSFSALSKLQNSKIEFNEYYLNIVATTAIISFPLFIGGAVFGDIIIVSMLGETWIKAVDLFRYLCISQLFTAMNAINNFAHAALGNPDRGMKFDLLCLFFMPVSFWYFARFGMMYILVPWLSVYVIICSCWIAYSSRCIGISARQYIRAILHPIIASVLTSILCQKLKIILVEHNFNVMAIFFILMSLGSFLYILYITLSNIKALKFIKSKIGTNTFGVDKA
jgi:O-antigen/teichoic acid export membrane protein